MATTSLWHISGRLTDVINYIENPDKTRADSNDLGELFSVIDYVKRGDATADGAYVTAINCMRETAFEQMIMTKKQFGKTEGYIAWHGYQSFLPGEISADECHQIGIELAKEMWGDRFQIIVTTHLDKDHLHNHFCFNSVSYRDGKKYDYSKSERRRMMEISDRLCRERGLSVIEHPHATWGVAAIFLGFSLQEFASKKIFFPVISILLYAAVATAIMVMAIVLIIQRYKNSLLGDEAYFNHVLPVSVSAHMTGSAESADFM